MKVGLFNDSFPPSIDGVANTVLNYAQILNKHNCESVVITPEYPSVEDNYDFKVYRYTSVDVNSKFPYRVGVPFVPKCHIDLYKEHFDLLHVHCPFASMVLAHQIKIESKNKPPIIFTYHTKFDIDIENFVPHHPFKDVAMKFLIQNINYADEVWCVSSGAVNSLRKVGYKGDVRVMPNGTDFPKGKLSEEEVVDLRKKYDIGPSDTVFLFCGRIMWYKNLKLVIDGLKMLKDDGYHFKTLFVGSGPDENEIKKYVSDNGLTDNIIFTGGITDRNEIRKYYSISSLLLFPSSYDTSGLVVKEAAACECPAILIKDSCASEGVTDMRNGLLIEENSTAFYKKIASVINEKDLLKQLGKNAVNEVYFSWNDSVMSAYKRYVEILAKK